MKGLLAYFFACISVITYSQTLFYQDEFIGGATASGGSPGAYATFTPSDFEIFIPNGSTIRKAYLFAGRHGAAPDTEVDLNGIVYTFNEDNQVSGDFYSIYGESAGVHAIEITDDIDTAVSDYTLTVVDDYFGPSNIFLDFYLFITYDNPCLDSTYVSIYLNEDDFDDSETDPVWEINLSHPIDTTCADVAITYMTGYACFMSDGEDAYINDTYIGTWGGNEDNSGDCGGPVGSFTYYDGLLTGLMDDDEDAVVNETDVIATINDYVTIGSAYFELDFNYATPGSGESSNAIWLAAILSGQCAATLDTALVIAGDDVEICKGDSVQIDAFGEGDFEWSPAEFVSDSSISNPFAFPETTTIYVVSLLNGCYIDYDSLTVFVDEFEIQLEDEIELCIGEDIPIGVDAEDNAVYNWQPADFLNDATIANPLTSATENITYTLIATDENNCVSQDTVDIVIISADVTAGNDTLILFGGTADIFATGDGVIYQWQPTDYIECAECAITTASPPYTTTYVIMSIDEDGCVDYDSVTVNIDRECSNLVQFPNAFSPNDDNINDVFLPITYLQDVENPELKIYNRWGEMIFQSNDMSLGWDGSFGNESLPIDNYIYTFTFNCFGEKQILNGSVAVIR